MREVRGEVNRPINNPPSPSHLGFLGVKERKRSPREQSNCMAQISFLRRKSEALYGA